MSIKPVKIASIIYSTNIRIQNEMNHSFLSRPQPTQLTNIAIQNDTTHSFCSKFYWMGAPTFDYMDAHLCI